MLFYILVFFTIWVCRKIGYSQFQWILIMCHMKEQDIQHFQTHPYSSTSKSLYCFSLLYHDLQMSFTMFHLCRMRVTDVFYLLPYPYAPCMVVYNVLHIFTNI